ncbi:MAG: single-stranded DNA-binding protein [Pseudomonadota bacterium]
MIDALIAGRLHGAVVERTSRNGNAFVTCTVRVPTANGETAFVSVVTFSHSTGKALAALADGDAVALVGELKLTAYIAKDGQPKPSIDLVAQQCLTEYHTSRKRNAMRKEEPAPAVVPPAATESASPSDREFNDEIPF